MAQGDHVRPGETGVAAASMAQMAKTKDSGAGEQAPNGHVRSLALARSLRSLSGQQALFARFRYTRQIQIHFSGRALMFMSESWPCNALLVICYLRVPPLFSK